MTDTKISYNMSPEDKLLVQLRDELYKGNWETFLTELEDRLKGRPYIFKIVNRIEEDIERIETLRAYEIKNKANLADLLEEHEKVKPIR